jgi:hypothetical protein
MYIGKRLTPPTCNVLFPDVAVGFLYCVDLFTLLGLVYCKYPVIGKMSYQATR